MKWLTREYIRQQAKKGLISAIKCSIKHHQQIRNATKKELQKSTVSCRPAVVAAYCALCQRFTPSEISNGISCCACSVDCPLWNGKDTCCCDEWDEVSKEYSRLFLSCFSHTAFRKAENKLIAKLKQILKKAQKNEHKRP